MSPTTQQHGKESLASIEKQKLAVWGTKGTPTRPIRNERPDEASAKSRIYHLRAAS